MVDVVLITGCSSGIGRATALRLAASGYLVYATARNLESVADLAAAGCRTLSLDVTDEQSMTAAVAEIEQEHGAVDVLVNNAGYGQYGAIEQLAIEDLRAQFETNVFGAVRLAQLVLPAMRARHRGRILNISSMGGRTTLPGGGAYHASKYALEAISDALRMEVRSFGIYVVLIEPGIVRTPWADAARPGSTDSGDDPYGGYLNAVEQSFSNAYEGSMARLSISAEQVAEVILKAIRGRRPRPRYLISPMAKSLVLLDTVLPDRLHDRVLKWQYKLP